MPRPAGSVPQSAGEENPRPMSNADLLKLQMQLLAAQAAAQQRHQQPLATPGTAAGAAVPSIRNNLNAAQLYQAALLQAALSGQAGQGTLPVQQQLPAQQQQQNMVPLQFHQRNAAMTAGINADVNGNNKATVPAAAQPQLPTNTSRDNSVTSAQMTTHTINQTTRLCDSILNKNVAELKGADPIALIKLRERSKQLFQALDDVIVKVTPFTKYSRSTVDACIDKFRTYKFQKMTALCDYNLGPILRKQVRDGALRAERGDVALDMLAALLGFFVRYANKLDDGKHGSGREFMDEWIECAMDALGVLPESWDDIDVAEELLGVLDDCGRYRTNSGFFDVQEQLEALVGGYESDYDYIHGDISELPPPNKKLRH